ncbi:MAG: hypothetical protein AABX27_00820 [Nanoarchaeota archaeon]
MTKFEEAYTAFIMTYGQVGTYVEVERMLVEEFSQDKSTLAQRVKNAYRQLDFTFHANKFPDGDQRMVRNVECYSRLNDKVREFGK